MSGTGAGDRPRILHVITGLHTGGAEMMLEKLTAGGGERGFAHAVVSLLARGPVGERLEQAGMTVRYLGLRRGIPTPWAILALRRMAARFRPAVVHGWLIHGNLAALTAARGRAPVIWGIRQSVHDLRLEPRRMRMLLRLAAWLSGRPARITYNSRAGADDHERLGFRRAKSVVIPNGFDLDVFRPDPDAPGAVRAELGWPADAPVVGMIARFDPIKGHRVLLQAAARVVAARDDVRFLLAGRGVDDGNPLLSAQLEALGLRRHVRMLGERRDTARLFAACDVSALASSYSEGFPNVLGESMACGTPCVATDVSDCRWIIGDTGYVVPPLAPDLLGDALLAVLAQSSEARRALGTRARARVGEHFALPKVRASYETLYRTVIAEHARAGRRR